MLIPEGVIVAWPGTQASIPSGWARVTSLDGRYVKGTAAGVNPDVTGGAATHTHTDPGHTHSIGAHTHGAGSSGSASLIFITDAAGGGGALDHTHTTGTSGSNSGTSGSTAGAWATANNDPAYVAVIWIASDGTPAGFPAASWALWNSSSALPTNWSNPAAARDVFPKGAVTAGNGGGTGGGAHVHVGSAHTHTWNGHTHTGGTSGSTTPAQSTRNNNAGPSQTYSHLAHTHAWSADSGASSGNSATSADSGSTSYEPPWAKLAIVQNDSGGADVQPHHVALWLGSLSAIPVGWTLCDGSSGTVDMRGKFLKGANGVGQVGNTGGTAGHSHTAPAGHTHSYDHTHTVTLTATTTGTQTPPYGNWYGGSPSYFMSGPTHTHAGGGTGTGAGTSGTTAQTAPSNADTQPPFRTVAFIEYAKALEVTVDEPEEDAVLGAPSQLITWSLAFDPAGGTPVQNDYRVRVFAEDLVEVVYDSGTVASATQEHQLPSGFLHNDLTYFIQVDATDTLGLSTVSALRQVTTSWVPPATITNLTAVQVGG